MVRQMVLEGFGHCTLFGECQAACPKEISIDTITRMNRDFLRASLTAGRSAVAESD
jgi:succinate dehydrogenase / fumarate reductase iron-sulfur subunit